MTRLLDPPAFKVAVQRLICTSCGSEANASCTCGVAYMPKSIRAAEAIAKNPEKSDRAIAVEIGVSQPTVSKARTTDKRFSVEARTGLDGKTRKMPAPHTSPTEQALIDHAHKLLDKIVHLLRQMDQRQRVSFRVTALQQMADAYLDDNVIEY
jgi:hypothetical protein